MLSIDVLESKKRTARIIRFFGSFILIFLICYLFPSTGDDWDRIAFTKRNLQGFYDLAQYQYANLNGRVIGNLLSYLLIGRVPRAIAKTLALFALTGLIAELSRIRHAVKWPLAIFVVMSVPRLIFVQVYPWTAGFFNYVPPMIGILYVITQLTPLFKGRALISSAPKTISSFLIGIVLCLFVEHVTLLTLVMATFIVLWQLLRKERPAPWTTAFLLGAILGCVILFGSPVYGEILTAEDSYRSIPKNADSLADILVQNYRAFSRYMLFENPVFLVLVCILIATVRRVFARRARDPILLWFLALPVYVFISRVPLGEIFYFSLENMQSRCFLPLILDAGIYLITYLMLFVTGFHAVKLPAWRRQYAFLLGTIPVIVAPLFVVRPVLARNYYSTYLLLSVCMLMLIQQLWNRAVLPKKKITQWLRRVCLALLIFYVVIYLPNHIAFEAREEAIAIGMKRQQKTIVIPDYPFPFYVFGPKDSSLGHRYYYEKPDDIEFMLESEVGNPESMGN
ncbi:MAG: DUF6056 family protein [Tissierellia bacterium]|nr:DUF6056 family protein [Tissierellia bacterium]